MPLERGDRGIHGCVDGRPGRGRADRSRAHTKSLAQGDHVVEGDKALAIARREMLGQTAEDRWVAGRNGCREAIDKNLGIGQEFPEREVAVARAERGVLVDGQLERSSGEPRRGVTQAGRVGRVSGGLVEGRQAEGWVAHEPEV